MAIFENENYRTRDTRETRKSVTEEEKTLGGKDEPVTRLLSREVEVGSRFNSIAEASANWTEGMSLVLLEFNCRSVYINNLEFWNLVDTYNPDVVIGTESWIKEDISNAEVFVADVTSFYNFLPFVLGFLSV